MKYLVIGFFFLGLALFAYTSFAPVLVPTSEPEMAEGQGLPLVAVTLPELSSAAEQGRLAFEANCAACHGVDAAGQDGEAPPLVHVIYEPNHHADASFYRAVQQGVRAHHWRFGDMPPIEGIGQNEIASIILYVRELQRANGIH